MNASRRVLPLLVVASLLALVASCVESKNPLSDEKTSKIDERLIGMWKDADDGVWKVKKSDVGKKALVVEVPGANEHFMAFTTTIKSKSYLSMAVSGDAEKEAKSVTYEIYQYVFVDKDTVEIRGMDSDVILKAIADKTIGGQIVITKTTTKPFLGLFGKEKVVEEKEPLIADTSENIARYLQAHADECYPAKTDAMLGFKRQK